MSPLSNLGGVPGTALRRLVRRPITPIDGATLAAIGGDGRIRVVLTGNSLRKSEVPRIDTSTRDFRAFFFFFSVVSFVDLTFSLGLDGNEIDLAAIGNVIKSVSMSITVPGVYCEVDVAIALGSPGENAPVGEPGEVGTDLRLPDLDAGVIGYVTGPPCVVVPVEGR